MFIKQCIKCKEYNIFKIKYSRHSHEYYRFRYNQGFCKNCINRLQRYKNRKCLYKHNNLHMLLKAVEFIEKN